MSEIIEHRSEQNMPWYRQGEVWVAVGGVATGFAMIGGQVWADQIRVETAKQAEIFTNQMKGPVAQDGFTLLSVHERVEGVAEGSIQIAPNCTFDEVDMQVERTSDGKVTDVTTYSIDTVLNGEQSYRYDTVRRRYVPTVTGEPATLKFDNREDLMNNVLDKVPCATLAENVRIINEN